MKIDDRAVFHAKSGATYSVIVKSSLKTHADAPGRMVRECLFLESPEGPNVLRAVDADRITTESGETFMLDGEQSGVEIRASKYTVEDLRRADD